MFLMRSSEMEFLAEQELISIMPFFELKENAGMLHGISGDFGPFHPSMAAQVPLWLAIKLKQLNKCRIIQPSWFTVEHLMERMEGEGSSELFESLPFHYLEVATLLLKHAAADMEQAEKMRLILEDIQHLRQDKIRNGLCRIANDVQTGGSAYAVQLNNVAAMEINSVRQFMTGSLKKFYELNALESGASQSQFTSQASSMDTTPSSVSRLRRHR
ncbi:DNA replication complex GINS protein PSF2 [Achlya hypogyna]|uniref:DNA replication complex GINS protein PSF2 n=1 Tax=Achlya hypogyna TaxID=1202772 RepID=A0A1V9Z659_ACHHY|nr:DNA replication complex GINS protein PSF2 [Achlya hypogyna]